VIGNNEDVHVVIITGLSGAGRSQAAKVLEDIGYFVVDNLPVAMIGKLMDTLGVVEGERQRLAIVADTRTRMNAEILENALVDLRREGIPTTVLFLDADDAVLHRRFKETRRPHPVDAASLAESIAVERAAFEDVRASADVIVDTTQLSVHQLRDRLREAFSDADSRTSMRVVVTSFGFKRGAPSVVDLMFDVRFLPNPHWDPDLRPLTGLDEPVRAFVFDQPQAAEFLERVTDLLDFLLPQYELEGKSYLTIGIGCTGGRHRSVAMADAIGKHLAANGVDSSVNHRDLEA